MKQFAVVIVKLHKSGNLGVQKVFLVTHTKIFSRAKLVLGFIIGS